MTVMRMLVIRAENIVGRSVRIAECVLERIFEVVSQFGMVRHSVVVVVVGDVASRLL